MSYFDDLVIDIKQEKPRVDGDVEAPKRLLYLLKAALNGSAMVLSDKSEPASSRVVCVSPEWLDLLGWTAQDLNDDPDQLFHPDDLEMIAVIGANDLAGPYSARMVEKGQDYHSAKWYMIEGLSLLIDDRHFRCFIVEQVT